LQMQNILCLYFTFAENICQGIFAFANNFILKHGGRQSTHLIQRCLTPAAVLLFQ